ncbi:MAG TPA: glycosyltransferase family 4 protein [Dehalococcoidia bacterium]|nr:glycosyltransferase family 4 protein [Dehalococcoidia bacterium]
MLNLSRAKQLFGPHTLPPGQWTDLPRELAATLANKLDYRVDSQDLIGDYCFAERDMVYLGWSSPLHYADGYGSIAQEIARAFLEDPKVRLSIFPRDYDPGHFRFGGYALEDWEEKAFVPRPIIARLSELQDRCFYGINMTWPRDLHRYPFPRAIGLTMFETSRPPSAWAQYMNRCRRIVVPCKQNKEAFEGIGVTVPIHVVNLGVNPDAWPYVDRSVSGEAPSPFTFLMAAGLTHRKNPVGAARAFVAAFPQEPDVRLTLKTRGTQTVAGFRDWAVDLPNDERIRLVCEESTPRQMHDWMAHANAFVFPSRGEGFGLTPLQAMATGLPTIVSDNSGMSEYADSRYCYPLPCEAVPVPRTPVEGGFPIDWGDVGDWWEPDFDALVATYQQVYRNYTKALDRGKRAAEAVRERWTIERTAAGILDVVMQDAREDGLLE